MSCFMHLSLGEVYWAEPELGDGRNIVRIKTSMIFPRYGV